MYDFKPSGTETTVRLNTNTMKRQKNICAHITIIVILLNGATNFVFAWLSRLPTSSLKRHRIKSSHFTRDPSNLLNQNEKNDKNRSKDVLASENINSSGVVVNASTGSWIASLNPWSIRSDVVSNDLENVTDLRKGMIDEIGNVTVASSSTKFTSQSITNDKSEQNNDWNVSIGDEYTFLNTPLSRVFNLETLIRFMERDNLGQKQQNFTSLAKNTLPSINRENVQIIDMSSLVELSTWDKWVGDMWQKTSTIGGMSAERVLRQATLQIESLVNDASTAVSLETIQALLLKSSYTLRLLESNPKNGSNTSPYLTTTSKSEITKPPVLTPYDFIDMATQSAVSRGLGMIEVADRARETTAFAANVLSVADSVLRNGYVQGDPISKKQEKTSISVLKELPIVQGSKSLFADFSSVYELNTYTPDISKAAEMGALSGAIYLETVPRCHTFGQTIVAQGTTLDVAWMITDSIASQSSFGYDGNSKNIGTKKDYSSNPFLVRTITIRGFDASDEKVDRELLVNRIVNATPERIRSATIKAGTIYAHTGLLEIARAIYEDVKQYIEWTAPTHKIVLNGHSIGGSVSLLLLFIMAQKQGSEYIRKKIAKVYTFGSPPVVVIDGKLNNSRQKDFCDILDAFDLPSSLVYAYVQPWDPVIRLFSEIDALYPLVEDLGEDGITPWANGPYRTLRPITKAIFEAWNGWPEFRDIYRDNASQKFVCVGIQHLLLPDPTRYLADRFLAVNIPVPPVATVLRVSPWELYSALKVVFPLDVFEVSFIPQAVRSFVHHFFPAYDFPLVDYVKELERRSRGLPERNVEFAFAQNSTMNTSPPSSTLNGTVQPYQETTIDWKKAKSWLRG